MWCLRQYFNSLKKLVMNAQKQGRLVKYMYAKIEPVSFSPSLSAKLV